MFATGIGLLLGPHRWRSELFFLHKASFILWIGALAIHVLGHLLETVRLAPRDWVRRTRRQASGAGLRQWTIAASLVVGVLLGLLVIPQVGPWLATGIAGH